MILKKTILLPCLTLWHYQKTQQVSDPNPDSEKVTPIDTLREDDMEVVDFTLMYDVDTDHPWSSYLSTDSSYVLRLEKLYEDSLGCSYRALIYEPEYWYRGATHYPPFGKEPTYVGYGTDYYDGCKDHELEFSFIRDAGDTYIFELFAYYRDWDSVLISNPIPFPWLSDEDDYVITYKKCDWEELRKWWDRKQAKYLGE